MAHILFIYKQFPAPHVGHAGGVSLYRMMEAMHRRGHTISLVARIRSDERRLLPHTETICAHLYTVPHHRTLPGPRPYALVRSYLALRCAAARALRQLRPDLVHVETTQTAAILMGLRLPPASVRPQDVNWFLQRQQLAYKQGADRLITRLKAALFHRLESSLYRRYDVILAISEGDRQLLLPLADRRPLILLPLAPTVHPTADIPPAVPPGHVLLFVGAMSRAHNLHGILWFLDTIWPRILARQPDVRLYIVGSHPPQSLRARADGEHLFVTGFVDDLTPWYRAADLFISPLRVGGGMLQKIVDAMVMGVPVVATSVCNFGIRAIPGKAIHIADTPDAFAAAVLHLLRDTDARRRLGEAGRRFIRERYDMERAVDRWEAALLRLLTPSAREGRHART